MEGVGSTFASLAGAFRCSHPPIDEYGLRCASGIVLSASSRTSPVEGFDKVPRIHFNFWVDYSNDGGELRWLCDGFVGGLPQRRLLEQFEL